MSKTPASKAKTKKPAAKKVPAHLKKLAHAPKKKAAPVMKPAAAAGKKTVSKAPMKSATVKTAAKAALPEKAKKAPAKAAPAGKTSPAKTAPTPKSSTAKTVAPKSAPAKVVVAKPAPAPTRAAALAAPVAPAPPKRAPSSRASARAAATPAQAPLPPPTSRFADRFAPPRPPTRQMAQVEVDTPRRVQISDPKLANAWKSKAGRDLSDAEILAMPESEYMNDKQLEFFRHTLQDLKNSLLSNAGETTEHLREDTSIVPDPADRATIEEEHALELRTRDRERKLLKKITQSLSRIEAGDYGFCDETGEPIGLGRLIARPTATLSLEAQQRRELKQKMFGD